LTLQVIKVKVEEIKHVNAIKKLLKNEEGLSRKFTVNIIGLKEGQNQI
jgi:hypothetical protein